MQQYCLVTVTRTDWYTVELSVTQVGRSVKICNLLVGKAVVVLIPVARWLMFISI